MYTDLRITNFRGFRSFTMDGLGRINLLVGPNSCGKTTVLEAIDLLADYPDPVALGARCLERGGVTESGDSSTVSSSSLALRHLFHGHLAQVGTEFSLKGNTPSGEHILAVAIANQPRGKQMYSLAPPPLVGPAWLQTQWDLPPNKFISNDIPVNNRGDWPLEDWEKRAKSIQSNFHIPHLSVDSLGPAVVAQRLSEFALNPEEGLVLEILRLLEPRVEGIAAAPTVGQHPNMRDNRSGIYVKLKGQRARVPIGSIGEGMWRLLGLAISLVRARGTILLVDEIDIGLHYSVQPDMWRMVKQTAEQLDVQVFATTHSRDCIEALAKIVRPEVTEGSQVTIQRIESERAVAYSEREISLAAERGIEVR